LIQEHLALASRGEDMGRNLQPKAVQTPRSHPAAQ
jgi:hypothetical protein